MGFMIKNNKNEILKAPNMKIIFQPQLVYSWVHNFYIFEKSFTKRSDEARFSGVSIMFLIKERYWDF